jgi:hypothetical protein
MDVRKLGMDGLCRREGGRKGSESTEALIRFPLLGVDRGEPISSLYQLISGASRSLSIQLDMYRAPASF